MRRKFSPYSSSSSNSLAAHGMQMILINNVFATNFRQPPPPFPTSCSPFCSFSKKMLKCKRIVFLPYFLLQTDLNILNWGGKTKKSFLIAFNFGGFDTAKWKFDNPFYLDARYQQILEKFIFVPTPAAGLG